MRDHTELPDNLTFEDFDRYANREPDFEGKWIYKVEQAFFTKKRRRNKSQYPKIEIDRKEERYFLTYPDAVEFIRKNKPDDLYCSWLTQVPAGEPSHYFGAAWLFDPHGEMIDYTITYHLCIDESFDKDGTRTVFWGRPQSRLRFKKGDIVEVCYRDEVTLAVVDRDVTDVEWSWGVYNRCRDDFRRNIDGAIFYILDDSDESMIVLDGPSYACHDHVSPLRVMKPRFPIPAELEAEMNTWIGRTMEKQERTITFSEDELNRIYIDYRNISKATSYSNWLTIAMFSTTTLSKIEDLEKFVIVHSADEAVSDVSGYFDLLPQQIEKIKTDDGTYHIKVCIPVIGNNVQRMKNAMYVCGFHFVSRQETTIGEHRFEWLQFMPEKPMPTYEEWKKEQESDEDLGFRLSNLPPKRTGLSMMVWIEEKALPTANSSRSCSTYRYDRMPKMRFTNNSSDSLADSWLPISVEKRNPQILVKDYELNISDKDFILLKKWIVRNCDTLTDYWNSKIDTEECISKLEKV